MKFSKNCFRTGTVTSTSLLCLVVILWVSSSVAAQPADEQKMRYLIEYDFEPLRLAIDDLIETFGPEYSNGPEYLRRLDELQKARDAELSFDPSSDSASQKLLRLARELPKLQEE